MAGNGNNRHDGYHAHEHHNPEGGRRAAWAGLDDGREASANEETLKEVGKAEASRAIADERISMLVATISDLENRLKRTLAEQENARKRTQREAETAMKFATSGFAVDLLSSLDNLRHALDAAPDEDSLDEPMKRLVQGVKATERALLATMKKHGIRRIDPLHEPFDPNQHQVVAEVEGADLPAGSVAEVLQPGYFHHDRLLRPAMVNVAKSFADSQDL